MFFDMESHCFRCAMPFEEPHSIVIVGGDLYHKGCVMELICTSCNKSIGFLAGSLESSNYKISCIGCSKTAQDILNAIRMCRNVSY